MAPRKATMPKKNKKNFRPTEKGAGMTKAGVAAYRRANPGSKLKTAVTGKVKKGSKDAKRRASYCSRSKGQMKMHNINCKKTPKKRICAARRRWKCQMKADDVLKLLEKHEKECNGRYAQIQKQLDKLDQRLWGIAGLIVAAAVVQKVF